MTWKAELTSLSKDRGLIVPVVTFTDSLTGEAITQDFRADDINADRLAIHVARRIASLEARDIAFATLALGPITSTALDRTPEQEAADVFFAKLTVLNSLLAQAAKGLLKQDDAAIAQAQTDVKTIFLPEYQDDVRFR